ncbi:MAG: hypothetical protein WBM69_08290 [Desulfobacterales bacterium]
MENIFDGKKTEKFGTEKNPAIVNVQTEERVKELESVFEENGWKYTIELEPDKPEIYEIYTQNSQNAGIIKKAQRSELSVLIDKSRLVEYICFYHIPDFPIPTDLKRSCISRIDSDSQSDF